jgi:transcriptional regulator GlxA family with amidase domain
LQSWSGLRLAADRRYDEIEGPIDTLLVSGGMEIWEPDSAHLIDWIRQQAKIARRVGSLCTGTFLLAQTGLLDGHRVTTHWYFSQQLAARFPNIVVDPNPIYIRDGKLSTSAGGTSNFDLALAMVEEDLGTDIALRIARGLVLFVRRPAGQNQFSTSLSFQSSVRAPIRELPVFILEHLGEPLTVDVLAEKASMSVRNFSRLFRQEYGTTPAAFVEKLRLETAQRLVIESNASLDEIAGSCGFGGINAMRRAFQDAFGKTPARMRSE